MFKKKLYYFLGVLTVVAIVSIAYYTPLAGFIFAVFILTLSIITALITAIKYFQKKSVKKILKYYFIFLFLLLLGILLDLLKPYPEVTLANTNSITEKISHLYDTDQYDRKNLKSYLFSDNAVLISSRDSIRLEFAYSIFREYQTMNLNLTPEEKYKLAMIFHHGKTSIDYEIAHTLAKEAYNQNNKLQNAEWLMKASYDRLQLSIGKPQKYGTQRLK